MTYADPRPIDATTASMAERQAHTLALLADAERALRRVRMEGTRMTYELADNVLRALDAVSAAQRPDTAVGVGLHE